MNTMPMALMKKYQNASFMASVGVLSRFSRGRAKIRQGMVRHTPSSSINVSMVPMDSRCAFSSPEPLYWASIICPPMLSPIPVEVNRLAIWLPTETPDSPAEPTNCPTIIISTTA